MKTFWAATILLGLAASPVAAQRVDTAEGNWSNIPAITARGNLHLGAETVDRIERLADQGVCNFSGFTRRRIDLTVPFMMQFDSGGSLQRIVVRRLGCPQLESLMGGLVLQMAQRGEYRPTGQNDSGWYRSEFAISLR